MWDLDYKELYQFSLDHPEKYWDQVAKDAIWSKPYTSVLEDRDSTSPKWYVGGEINMCFNCLDVHVEDGYGDDIAVIHDSPLSGSIQRFTYKELLEIVQLLAGVMSGRCGVVKGDRVLLYFPMIPQCLMAMLACTRIGAVYTTVFGGFAAKELGARIRYFEPKLIVLSNIGLEPGKIVDYKEKLDDAIILSGFSPEFCLVYNRPNYASSVPMAERDLDWSNELSNAIPQPAIPVESSHPLFVIFTSGTTGEPKGIVKSTGGSVVTNKYTMRRFCNLKPGEVWWAMSDFGWIVGQTVLSYGPLMSRIQTIIHEGKVVGPMDTNQLVRVLNSHKVNAFLSVTTNMKVLRKFSSPSDLILTYDGLRSIFMGGEVTDNDILEWTSDTFKCPAYNVWAQTEIGSIGCAPGLGFTGFQKYLLDNSLGIVMPSFQIKIVDRDTGIEVPKETIGRILCKMPMNPSAMMTLYKNHQRYIDTYLTKYPGYFDTMDAGMITKDGLLKVVARDDDIINVGAARICGTAVEEACLRNKDVFDCAVVPLEDALKGHVPFAYLVVDDKASCSEKEIIEKTVAAVLDVIGEVACFQKAVIVSGLPKTTSGKTPRTSLADMVNGRQFQISSSIENRETYPLIYEVLIREGYVAYRPSIA